ncbi:MAG TPA: protein kinase [Gemmatimonadales bacterium]|nr:protein kinase [Gemmatimonadales bacterium]
MSGSPDRLAAALAERYRLERELGQGGMATVYLAHDLKHDRKVAIKVLRPELAAVIGAERFLREIKTIANLQHPHILGLIDSGQVQGTAYYVMPFVEGESLRDRLTREKQLPVADAVRLASEVAGALDYAHRHGVIHRDIKPENVLLHDGSALVADFGIALAVSAAGGTRMTETGMSLGTPHYMSPEQAMGEREITARSDVYALGAMTYEMLIGEPPFTGPTAQAIIAKVMTGEPASLTGQRKSVPPEVEAAVLTALEKLPADRFATAAEFAAALKGAPGPATTGARPRSGRPATGSPRALQVVGVIAIVATLAALALAVKLFNPRPAPVTRLSLDIPDLRVNHIGYYGNAIAIAPDGSRMAFVVGKGGTVTRLAVRDRDELQPRILDGTEGADGPFFSPDGAWIGFFAGGSVYKIPAAGGPPVKIADGTTTIILGGVWRPDNQIVYPTPTFALMAVPAAGGTPAQLVPAPANGAQIYPTLLPRKDVILATRCGNNCAQQVLVAAHPETGRVDTIMQGGTRAFYLPTGVLVVVRFDGTVVGAPFDLDRLRFKREPVVLLSGVQLELGVIPEIAIAGDGTLIYLPSDLTAGSSSVAEVDRTGRSRILDPSWQGRFTSIGLSPDGQRLAVSLVDGTSAMLWVKQLDTGPLTRISFDGTVNYRPAWLPDGRSLSFSSDADRGLTFLYRARADGSDKPVRLFPADTSQIDEADWSRDGQWVAYRTGVISGVRDIYARRVTGDTARLTVAAGPTDEYNPAISPDGRWIAYVSLESGREEVYVRPFPDVTRARWQVSPAGGTSPVWAHSGRELFYLANDSMMAASVAAPRDFEVVSHQALFGTRPFVFQPWHQAFGVRPGDRSFIMLQRPAESGAGSRRLTAVLNWFGEVKARLSAGQ